MLEDDIEIVAANMNEACWCCIWR